MADKLERIGIITSGGDCGGLNAVIKGAALAGHRHGIRSFVIPNGYAGLYNLVDFGQLVELSFERRRSLTRQAQKHRRPRKVRPDPPGLAEVRNAGAGDQRG